MTIRAHQILLIASFLYISSSSLALDDSPAEAVPETPHPTDEEQRHTTQPRPFSETPTRCSPTPERRSGQYDIREDEGVLGTNPEPEDIHVSFAETDASSSLSFVWLTGASTRLTRVQIGLSEDRLTHTVTGRSFTMEDLMEDDPRRIHEVRICGLPAGQTIYYRVGGPGAWSTTHTVKTGPDPGSNTPFRFIYGGDSRGNAPVWNRVSDALEEVDADFMLFNGDLVGNGWNQRLWDIFFDVSNPLFAETVLVPAIGNHENDALNYDLLLSLPGDERNFIQRYGNVAFVIFDDNFGPETLRDEVRPRVEAMLQEVEDAEWVVLVNHQPMYSAGGHASDRHLQEHILDLVDRYEVDLVVHGHSHFYQRTVPIRAGAQDPDGSVFIVSGGLGSPLHEAGTSEFTVTSVSTYHYMVIEVAGSTMSLKAIDLDGNVLDKFSMSSESPAPQTETREEEANP